MLQIKPEQNPACRCLCSVTQNNHRLNLFASKIVNINRQRCQTPKKSHICISNEMTHELSGAICMGSPSPSFNFAVELHRVAPSLPPLLHSSICRFLTRPCWRNLQPSSSALHPQEPLIYASPRLRLQTSSLLFCFFSLACTMVAELSAALPLGAKRALQRWQHLCLLSSAPFVKYCPIKIELNDRVHCSNTEIWFRVK